eukprot:PhF_6_TR6218/c0_g1_i1/m.9377
MATRNNNNKSTKAKAVAEAPETEVLDPTTKTRIKQVKQVLGESAPSDDIIVVYLRENRNDVQAVVDEILDKGDQWNEQGKGKKGQKPAAEGEQPPTPQDIVQNKSYQKGGPQNNKFNGNNKGGYKDNGKSGYNNKQQDNTKSKDFKTIPAQEAQTKQFGEFVSQPKGVAVSYRNIAQKAAVPEPQVVRPNEEVAVEAHPVKHVQAAAPASSPKHVQQPPQQPQPVVVQQPEVDAPWRTTTTSTNAQPVSAPPPPPQVQALHFTAPTSHHHNHEPEPSTPLTQPVVEDIAVRQSPSKSPKPYRENITVVPMPSAPAPAPKPATAPIVLQLLIPKQIVAECDSALILKYVADKPRTPVPQERNVQELVQTALANPQQSHHVPAPQQHIPSPAQQPQQPPHADALWTSFKPAPTTPQTNNPAAPRPQQQQQQTAIPQAMQSAWQQQQQQRSGAPYPPATGAYPSTGAGYGSGWGAAAYNTYFPPPPSAVPPSNRGYYGNSGTASGYSGNGQVQNAYGRGQGGKVNYNVTGDDSGHSRDEPWGGFKTS